MTNKPFLEVEEAPKKQGILAVTNVNPNYRVRWCGKAGMPASNRKGIYVVIDKRHPDFKGMTVQRDDTPDASYITIGDLILCATRKETSDKVRQANLGGNVQRLKNFDAGVKNASEKISRDAQDGISQQVLNDLDTVINSPDGKTDEI